MKNSSFYKIAFCSLVFSFAMASCGDKLDEYPWQIVDKTTSSDSDDSGTDGAPSISTIEGELITGLRDLQSFDVHAYQYQRTNTIDVFAGYLGVSQYLFTYGGLLASTYSVSAWQNYYTSITKKSVFSSFYNAYYYAEDLGYPEYKALAMIGYCFMMSQYADIYGPMPFDDWRNLVENPPITYVSVQEIYERCFEELKEAVDILNERQPSSEVMERVEGPDGGITNYDYLHWVKFANSIRLRLAMNIIKVDPTRAQTEAEAAINEVGGVLDCGPNGEVTDPDFYYVHRSASTGSQHPLYQICMSWNDSRLGASLENIMKRLRHPLLGAWFDKNYSAITNSQGQSSGYAANQDWVGIRQGCAMINKSGDRISGYGPFSCFQIADYPRTLMHVTEVLFARAEGALRGWNMGGTAQEWYERGVRRCFNAPEHASLSLDMTADQYLAQTDHTYDDYVDPYNNINNIDGRIEICAAWSDDDTDEVKLEKIITQRYIAIFPQSTEAWTTFRRTAYPRLFPVDPDMNNWEDDINCEIQIRRIPYYSKSASDQSSLTAAAATLAAESSEVGSTNNSTMTRIWWDINTDEIDLTSEEGRVIPNNF